MSHPPVIRMIAILQGIGGLALFVGIISRVTIHRFDLAGLMLLQAMCALTLAVGIWLLRKWAWYGTLLYQALNCILLFSMILSRQYFGVVGIFISIWILLSLWPASVKAHFH